MKFISFPIQGRALSRAKSRRNLDFQDVLDKLADMGIAIRVASPKLVMEEVTEILISVQHKTVYNLCQHMETAVFSIASTNLKKKKTSITSYQCLLFC